MGARRLVDGKQGDVPADAGNVTMMVVQADKDAAFGVIVGVTMSVQKSGTRVAYSVSAH